MRLLTLTAEQIDRLVLEKARIWNGRLTWVRWYLERLDDATIQCETPIVRLLAHELPLLIARGGWKIPNDPRWLAGRLVLRPEDVRRGVNRLLELGYITEIEGVENGSGAIQPALFSTGATVERPSSDTRATFEPPPSDTRATPRAVTDGLAQLSAADALPTTRRVDDDYYRQEQEQDKNFSTSNGTVASYAAAAHANNTNTLEQLLRLAARGNLKSEAVLRHEASGLPEYAIARTAESLRCRRPPPRNPAAYAVETLRALRRELGIPPPATIDREPPLGAASSRR